LILLACPTIGNIPRTASGLWFAAAHGGCSVGTRIFRDGTVVVVPAAGQLPYTGDETAIIQTIGIKPSQHLQIDNTYILERVVNGLAQHAVVNSNIIRSKWNYQFTREFSLRFIAQYDGLLSNPNYSNLQTTRT
jgi:hypothetical protein